jgi:hypothetical protein
VASGETPAARLNVAAPMSKSGPNEALQQTARRCSRRPPPSWFPGVHRSLGRRPLLSFVVGRDAVAEVIEFKVWDKLKALDIFAKHLGLLVDKLALTDPTGKRRPSS